MKYITLSEDEFEELNNKAEAFTNNEIFFSYYSSNGTRFYSCRLDNKEGVIQMGKAHFDKTSRLMNRNLFQRIFNIDV